MSIKTLFQEITPPILWRSALKFRRAYKYGAAHSQEFKSGVELPAQYYDVSFKGAGHWKKHYTDSHYYPLWTVIADRIQHAGIKKVLDIGCGPGQVACLLRDIGVPTYKGLDFSNARVSKARAVCPEYEFVAADVFQNDLLENYDYDCVLIMEFLEHIERDLDVLKRVRAGTMILATVPNFPAKGHVRYFNSIEEVQERYSPLCSQLDVTAILANKHGKTYYILQGTR